MKSIERENVPVAKPFVYRQPELLIGGRPASGGGRKSQPVVNPATFEVLGELPHATPGDLDDCLAAAQRGFVLWREVSPQERGRILKRAADILRTQAGELAYTVALEVGKPMQQGGWEAATAADTLEWFAEEGRRAYGRVLPGRYGGARFTVVKEPVGPVAGFAAWNFPLINASRKIGAALGAGCSCIYKPAEEAPSSGMAVARALMAAGLPQDALSVVFGVPAEVSAHLLASPVIRKLSFTGSVPVGRQLTQLAAQRSIRTTMELGGHGPVIVCADADVEQTAALAVATKYKNAGQVCVSPTRFLVHESVYARFTQAFVAGARALRLGPGTDPASDMGPMIHQRRRDAVHALVADACAQGATLACGGQAVDGAGWFYAPTVLTDVPAAARILHEEPFGPVALIARFTQIEQALAVANDTGYGLAAYAFSRDAHTLSLLASRLEAGMVALNSFVVSQPDAPFLGVKDSGHGAEAGSEGLEACLVTKLITQT